MTYFTDAMDIVQEEMTSQGLSDLGQDLLRLYTLLALATGEDTTDENVHDAWAAWRTVTRPDSFNLIPFEDLTPEVQAEDTPYTQAIIRAARRIRKKTPDYAATGVIPA